MQFQIFGHAPQIIVYQHSTNNVIGFAKLLRG